MRSAVRFFVAAASVCFAACQTSPPLGSSLVVRAPDDAAPPAGGGPVNGEPPKTLVSDASAATEVVTVKPGSAPPASCAALAATGASNSLDALMWERQVADGQGSDAWDFIWIEQGCLMKFQHGGVQSSVTMTPADCEAARAWVTSASFVDLLRTGGSCAPFNGQPDEVITVDLLAVAVNDQPRRKFFRCADPTLVAVRACLQPLVDRLFPR